MPPLSAPVMCNTECDGKDCWGTVPGSLTDRTLAFAFAITCREAQLETASDWQRSSLSTPFRCPGCAGHSNHDVRAWNLYRVICVHWKSVATPRLLSAFHCADRFIECTKTMYVSL